MEKTSDHPIITAKDYEALYSRPDPQPEPRLRSTREQYDFQIWRLRELGINIPDKDIDYFARRIPPEDQSILFIPPKPDHLDLSALMHLIEMEPGREGEAQNHPRWIKDLSPIPPEVSYLLTDVKSGKGFPKGRLDNHAKKIQQMNRLPHTLWQGIVHVLLFPHILRRRSLCFAGTRCYVVHCPSTRIEDATEYVPCMYNQEGNRAILAFCCGSRDDSGFLPPSAGGMISKTD